MSLVCFYCHGRGTGQPPESDPHERLQHLSRAIEVDPRLLTRNPHYIIGMLKEIPVEGDDVILLLHKAPFFNSLRDLVTSVPEGRRRLMMVLVSGDPISADQGLFDLASLARSRGVGGFTWWEDPIDSSELSSLKRAIDETRTELQKRTLSFQSFHELFRRQPEIAGEILDELSKIVCGDQGDLTRRLERWCDSDGKEPVLGDVEVCKALVKITQERREWERRRARLRHDDLSNKIVPAIRTLLRVMAGEVAGDQHKIASDISNGVQMVLKDVEQLLRDFDPLMSPKKLKELSWGKLSESRLKESDRYWRERALPFVDAAKTSLERTKQIVSILCANDEQKLQQARELNEMLRRLDVALGGLKR